MARTPLKKQMPYVRALPARRLLIEDRLGMSLEEFMAIAGLSHKDFKFLKIQIEAETGISVSRSTLYNWLS